MKFCRIDFTQNPREALSLQDTPVLTIKANQQTVYMKMKIGNAFLHTKKYLLSTRPDKRT